ncbi:hypothetical protein AAMO2058_000078500 [Amorphochlora amoebiformis]|eukprot:1383597-Amorphochlora_amoeboformis.AAC.1
MRRTIDEIPEEEIWRCTKECGKRYKKTSLHSIARHKENCDLWRREHPESHRKIVSVDDAVARTLASAEYRKPSSINFEEIFGGIFSMVNWPSIGRFVADPISNVMWMDGQACKILGFPCTQKRIAFTQAFYGALDQKSVFADVMIAYSRRVSTNIPYVCSSGHWNQLILVCAGPPTNAVIIGNIQDVTKPLRAALRLIDTKAKHQKRHLVQQQPLHALPRASFGWHGVPNPKAVSFQAMRTQPSMMHAVRAHQGIGQAHGIPVRKRMRLSPIQPQMLPPVPTNAAMSCNVLRRPTPVRFGPNPPVKVTEDVVSDMSDSSLSVMSNKT